MRKIIAYVRVSTDKQGRSGLGLEAQQAAIARHLGDVRPLATYVEVESGRHDDRPELRKALDHCRRSGGATLVVGKLDRLARSARFLLTLLDSGVEIQFCDLPQVAGASGRFLLTSMAAVAELEAGLISERTKAALQAAKARGVRLGNPAGAAVLAQHRAVATRSSALVRGQAATDRAETWRPIIAPMVADGLGDQAIAKTLNERGEPSVTGTGRWTATAVRRLRARLGLVHDAVADAA